MYTSFNREYSKQGKPSQVLMIATSDDLIHWEKTTEKLVAPQAGYAPNDWRDPFILWQEAAQRYVIILGARKVDGKKIRTGRTVYFTSTDLKRWTFQGDFWAPNLYLAHTTGDLFKFEVDVTFSATTRAFGVRLFEDEATGDAYEFIFHLGEQRVSFDRTPNLPWFRYMNRGLERPLHLAPDRPHRLQIIVDDTIATLYVDGVALNTRMYAKAGQTLTLYVVDGTLTAEHADLALGLR